MTAPRRQSSVLRWRGSAAGGTDGPTSTYHALALSLAAVGRCVDLYVSAGGTSRGTSPMLSEVLASEKFSKAVGRGSREERRLIARSLGRCDARYTRGA